MQGKLKEIEEKYPENIKFLKKRFFLAKMFAE